jgi:hypothetical protein
MPRDGDKVMNLPFDASLDVTLVKGSNRMRYSIAAAGPNAWVVTVEHVAPVPGASTNVLTTPEAVVASWEAVHREIDLAVTCGGWSSLAVDEGLHVRNGRGRTSADA